MINSLEPLDFDFVAGRLMYAYTGLSTVLYLRCDTPFYCTLLVLSVLHS